MQANSRRDTAPEARVRTALWRRGLRFRKNHRPVGHLKCEADVLFNRARVAVFIDGCFWHGCPVHGNLPKANNDYWSRKLTRNIERDRTNRAALEAAGWVVIQVWEHEDPQLAADRIAAHVTRSRPDAKARV